MSFAAFIENNRRAGTTTRLAEAALAADGYLVVENLDSAQYVLHAFPELKGRVLTLPQIERGTYPAEKRPLFFDLPATLQRISV